ncbi:MAG: hypothetical protein PHY25_01760 [Dehalococcoidales bacterium]|nr:hypothetical protein [Dehalococcoidales bacterium]
MTKKTNVIQSVSEESHTDWARPHVNSPMVPGVLSGEDPSAVNCLWMTVINVWPIHAVNAHVTAGAITGKILRRGFTPPQEDRVKEKGKILRQ